MSKIIYTQFYGEVEVGRRKEDRVIYIRVGLEGVSLSRSDAVDLIQALAEEVRDGLLVNE